MSPVSEPARAEIRMGEMLKATERARGTKGQLKGKKASGGTNVSPPENAEPTLADLGVTKRESTQAQALGKALEAIEKPKARERKAKGQKSGGRGKKKLGGDSPPSKEAEAELDALAESA